MPQSSKMKIVTVVAVLTAIASVCEAQSSTTPDYRRCDEGDNAMDPPTCPADDENGLPTYFPYPYDCTKYFECTNGVAKCIQCAPGTVWDQDLLTCNHQSVIPCRIVTTVPTTPTTSTTTTTTTTTTTPPPTTTTPTTTTTTTPTTTTTTTTTTEGTTTTEDPANWICPEGYVGKMPHPYRCDAFYLCDPGRRPCLFECPSPLYYNPISEICDWPQNVPSCQGGTPPPPTRSLPNYRNVRRFRTQEKSWFNLFQEERTTGGPCDEPSLRYEYY